MNKQVEQINFTTHFAMNCITSGEAEQQAKAFRAMRYTVSKNGNQLVISREKRQTKRTNKIY